MDIMTLAMAKMLAGGGSGLPSVTTDHDGYVLQVADGAWQAVPVADSSVKTYIDEYINEALGGDY